MKRRVSGLALLALVLTAITGCGVHYDGEDAVTHEFGSDYFGAGGMLNLTEPVEGDAILAGGHVNTASEVKGDLVVAGGEVSIGGAVGAVALMALPASMVEGYTAMSAPRVAGLQFMPTGSTRGRLRIVR